MRLRVELSSTRANRPAAPALGDPHRGGTPAALNTLRDEISARGRAVPVDRQYDLDHSYEAA